MQFAKRQALLISLGVSCMGHCDYRHAIKIHTNYDIFCEINVAYVHVIPGSMTSVALPLMFTG